MASEFITVVRDMLEVITQFSKSITHVHVRLNEDGTITAAAPSMDRSVEIRSNSKNIIPEMDGAACLHNLNYLKQILSSSFITNDTEVELSFREASNGKTSTLSTVVFSGKKYSTVYQAVDPFIGNVVRPSKGTIEDWPIEFVIKPDTAKDFKEARTIQGAAPKGKSSLDEVFELVYGDGSVMAFFGSGNNESILVLAEGVAGGDRKYSGYIMTDHFSRLLELKGKTDVKLMFCDKALKASFETKHCTYDVILSSRRIVENQ